MKWEIVVVLVPLKTYPNILLWYEIIKLSRVVHMCTNSSISAATRTQIFGHPGLNGLCVSIIESQQKSHMCHRCVARELAKWIFLDASFVFKYWHTSAAVSFQRGKMSEEYDIAWANLLKSRIGKKYFQVHLTNYYLLPYQTNFFKKPEKEG